MKNFDIKDKKVQKFLAFGLLGLSIVLFIVFLIVSGWKFINSSDDPSSSEESDIPTTGEIIYADESLFSPSVIQYTGESGITYELGSDEMFEIKGAGHAIALNPTCSKTDFKVGFYIDPNVGSFYSTNKSVDYAASEDNFFYIRQWTDEYIFSSKYESPEDYGVAFVIDESTIDTMKENDTEGRIAVRTVDLTNKRFLDAFFIIVGFNDDGKVAFTRTASADISHTNPSFDRNWIVDTAIMQYNDDGWAIGTTTAKDGSTKNEYYNPNDPIVPATRYVVELVDDMPYSPCILNRGEQGEDDRTIFLDENQLPALAVTPCYDVGNANNGLITIYVYPAFLNGGPGLTYLGYSDWNNPDCSPEVTFN